MGLTGVHICQTCVHMCAHVCTCVHMYTWPSHVFPCTPDHFPGPKCRFLVFKWCQHVPTHVYTCTPDLFPGLKRRFHLHFPPPPLNFPECSASCYKKPPPNTFVRRFFRNFSSGFEIHSIDWTNFRFFSRKSTPNTFGQRIFDLYFFVLKSRNLGHTFTYTFLPDINQRS